MKIWSVRGTMLFEFLKIRKQSVPWNSSDAVCCTNYPFFTFNNCIRCFVIATCVFLVGVSRIKYTVCQEYFLVFYFSNVVCCFHFHVWWFYNLILRPYNVVCCPHDETIRVDNHTLRPADHLLRPHSETLRPYDDKLHPADYICCPYVHTLRP